MTTHHRLRLAFAGLVAAAAVVVVAPGSPAVAGQIGADDVKLTTDEDPADIRVVHDRVNSVHLAVWADRTATSERIRGQVITDAGVPGDPFTVFEAADVLEPAVAANTVSGGWMVAFVTEEAPGAREVAVVSVSSSGTAGFASPATFVSSMGPTGDPGFDARRPAIAFNPDLLEFGVVWDGDDDTTANGEADLWARRVSTAGGLIGAELNLTGRTSLFDEENPSIAYTAGRYVIVYEEFDLDLVDFQVHNITTDGQFANPTIPRDMTGSITALDDVVDPRVAAGNGTGVYVFEGRDTSGLLSAWAGIVDPISGTFTTPFEISGPPSVGFEADDVQVAHHPVSGNFAIVWEGERSGVTAAAEEEIFATIVTPTLTTVEAIERISTMGVDGVTTSFAYSPAVTAGAGVGFYAVFGGDNPDPAAGLNQTPAGDTEVFGQQFGPTADLAVTAVTTPISPAIPLPGSNVQYSVAISNGGPSAADGIGLSAVVPSGLVIGAVSAGGTYTHPTTVDLGSGASTSITVNAQIAAGATKGQTIAPTFTALTPVGNVDPSGNNSGTAATITVDGRPVVTAFTVASDNTTPTVAALGDTITASITVDEAITTPEVTIAGLPAAVSGSGASWTATLSVDGSTPEGPVSAQILAAEDLVGLDMVVPVTSSNGVSVDRTPPVPVISSVESDPTNGSPIEVTVDFGESVSGFVAGDVTVGNGSVGSVSGGTGGVFTVSITPTVDGVVTVDVAAGVAADAAGNPNAAATQYSIAFDGAAPVPVISSVESDPTNGSPIEVTVDFGESVSGFVAGDVTVGNGSVGSVSGGTGGVFTVSITPTVDGVVTVDVAAGVAADAAGNPNAAATQFSIESDRTAPTVTVDQGATQTDSTNTAPIVFDVVFSEDVTGFTGGDVVVSGTAGATTATVTAVDASTYTVEVTDMTGAGTVIVTLAAGAASDAAGNASLASTSTDNLVTYIAGDVTPGVNDAPVVTAPASATGELAEPVAFTGPLSVAVTDPDALDGQLVVTLTIDTGELALGTTTGVSVTGGPTAWTLTGTLADLNAALASLTATISDVGTSTIEITADDQGNTDGAPLTDTATIVVTVRDTTAPTLVVPSVTVTVTTDPGQAGAIVTYDVSVTDPGSATPTERFVQLEPVPAVECTPVSGSFFPIGTTTVSCTATDSSGNTASAEFLVEVVDTEDPVISGARNQTFVLPAGTSGAVTYVAPTATDNSGTVSLACTPASGSTMTAGVVSVRCTATDPSGNTATATFTVTVAAAELPATGGGGLPVLPWALSAIVIGLGLVVGSLRRRTA